MISKVHKGTVRKGTVRLIKGLNLLSTSNGKPSSGPPISISSHAPPNTTGIDEVISHSYGT